MKVIYYTIVVFQLLFIGCSDFLEESSKDEVRPSEVSDMEQLLLGNAYMEEDDLFYNIMDIFTDDVQCNGLVDENDQEYFNLLKWRYIWASDMFTEERGGDDEAFWKYPYKKILGCNIVLDYLDKVNGDDHLREALRGEALVLRAYYYLTLVNMYGYPYNYGNPSENKGVPLKLDMEVKDSRMTRNTVAEVYSQIESDLLLGTYLLSTYNYERSYYRIGALAAKALLSRMYLYMEDWDKALLYADSVLIEKPELLNLNKTSWQTLSKWSERYGVYSVENSDEVIWMREGTDDWYGNDYALTKSAFTSSQELLSLYGPCTPTMVQGGLIEDLRGSIYFRWSTNESGVYERRAVALDGYHGAFGGIRTAELYLNRAECYIRKYMEQNDDNYRQKALQDLNTLRKHRWNAAYEYEDVEIQDAEELFDFYKEERRRELVGDAQHRWCDLRRYGMPAISHVFFEKETDNHSVVTIPTNRYILPIPEETIRLNPRLEQNL